MKRFLLVNVIVICLNHALATNSCQPIATPSPVICPSNCIIPIANSDLNINTNQTYCVPSESNIIVQNVNLNGGNLLVCGTLNVNTLNANGNTPKNIQVATNAQLNINQDLNLTYTNFINFGLVQIHGNTFHLNGSGNKFINTVNAKVDMTLSSGNVEFIIDTPSPSEQNEYYNFGKTHLQKLRVNGNDADQARICLNNSDTKYKFCVRKGMHLDPKTPFEVISNTIKNPIVNLIDTNEGHNFQNFYNNGNVIQKLFKSPQGYNGTWAYYNNSTTVPAIAFPLHPNFTPQLYEKVNAISVNDNLNCEDGVLPVELINFSAKEVNKHDVSIEWSTISEINNDKFILSRSVDGKTFKNISEVNGQTTTNSQSINHYDFIDYNVPNVKTLYYQLSQMDLDGQTKNLSIVSVNRTKFVGQYTLLSNVLNQGTNEIQINSTIMGSDAEPVVIHINTMNGIPVQTFTTSLSYGINSISLNNHLAAGLYVIGFKTGDMNQSLVYKFIVQ